jgi:hypothetical protein
LLCQVISVAAKAYWLLTFFVIIAAADQGAAVENLLRIIHPFDRLALLGATVYQSSIVDCFISIYWFIFVCAPQNGREMFRFFKYL